MTNRDSLVETAFPDLVKHSKHELEYSNSEYLYDIYGATSFTTTPIQINPGLMESFPILSGMSTQFETYKFTKLEYYYKPFVTNVLASSNTQIGFVGMLACYDPTEITYVPSGAPFTTSFPNKASYLNYEGAISAKSSVPMKFVVDCSRFRDRALYVRQGEFANIDLRISDLGTFLWACGDQQSTGLMGELYVKYSIKFQKSKPSYSLANSNRFAHFRLSGSISSTNPFGNVQTLQPGTNMDIRFLKSGSVANFFLLPPFPSLCNYMFYLQYVGTVGAWVMPTPTATNINLLNNGTSDHSSLTGNSTTMSLTGFFNTPNNLGTAGGSNEDTAVVFANASWTFLAAITSGDLFVMHIPTYAYSTP